MADPMAIGRVVPIGEPGIMLVAPSLAGCRQTVVRGVEGPPGARPRGAQPPDPEGGFVEPTSGLEPLTCSLRVTLRR